MKKNKLGILFLSFVFLFSTLSMSQMEVQAQSLSKIQDESDSLHSVIGMDEDSLNEELDQLIVLLEEMDSKGIDIVNLENNTPKQIELLSSAAKEVYFDYQLELQNVGTDELVGNVSFVKDFARVDSGEITTFAANTNVSGIYISNAQVIKLNKISGLSGGVFGVSAALIKAKLGLSPTVLTVLILAVSTLGLATLNACNWNNKGFYLTASFIGSMAAPVGTVACVPNK